MAAKKISKSEIKKFWNWFSLNCQDFGKDFSNAELISELDKKVVHLGGFSWEIGPGIKKENALVISPNGDSDLLPVTKEIIANAMQCEDWEYYYAKPPKQWSFIFDFTSVDGQELQINASEWEYVLLKYEDGALSIIIKNTQLSRLDEIDQLTAAEIVLDGALGEETRIEKIVDIEIVNEFDKSYANKASNIKNLLNHIKDISEK
jgi:hypothetical protein